MVCPSARPSVSLAVTCLSDFKEVRDAVFGMELKPNYKHAVDKFRESYIFLQKYVQENFQVSLEVSWKVHMVANHIVPFVENSKCGLGRYAEQCGEAIHAKFKPTWQRYKVDRSNSNHGLKLKASVVNLGYKRL